VLIGTAVLGFAFVLFGRSGLESPAPQPSSGDGDAATPEAREAARRLGAATA